MDIGLEDGAGIRSRGGCSLGTTSTQRGQPWRRGLHSKRWRPVVGGAGRRLPQGLGRRGQFMGRLWLRLWVKREPLKALS